MNPNLEIKKDSDNSIQYLNTTKLNNLFKEMINSLVHEQPDAPIPYMIKHLRSLIEENDIPEIKIDLSDFKMNPKPVIRDLGFPKGSTAKICNILTKSVLDKSIDKKTKLGGTISHVFNQALKFCFKEDIGLFLTDSDAYSVLRILVEESNKIINNFSEMNSLYDLKHSNEILSLKYGEKFREKIGYFRIKYARNIKGLPYLPYAKDKTQKLIKERLVKAIIEIEGEDCDFFPYSEESSEVDNRNFKSLTEKFFDNEQNLINNGVNQNCGIIISKNHKIGCEIAYLINFNDHLQLVSYNDNKNIDFRKCFEILDEKLKEMSKKIEFEYNKDYGFLNSCVSNCGEGLKISTGLNLQNLSKNGNFMALINGWDLKVKFLNKSNQLEEISAKHKNRINKEIFINSYIVKICSIINYEEKLEEDTNYKFPTANENNFSKKLKSVYSSYLSYLRYVITPNNKNFSNIFKFDKFSKRYNLCFPDKESYLIFKNIFSDYLAEKVNLSFDKSKENVLKEKSMKIYNEKVEVESLKTFGKSVQNISDKVNKVFLIDRRNLKNYNFSSAEKKSENLKNSLQDLSKEILNVIPGKIFDKEFLDVLHNSNFTFILDELKEFNENIFAFLNNDDSILVLFNGEDHIKVILNLQNYDKLDEEYSDYSKILDIVKPYCVFDDYFGFLTTNPCNSGPALEIRINFNNKDKKVYDEIKPMIKEFNLSRSSNFVNNFDVFNKIKANFTRMEIFEKFIELLNKIKSKVEEKVEILEKEEEVNTDKNNIEISGN